MTIFKLLKRSNTTKGNKMTDTSIEKYRSEGSSLFTYDYDTGAYVHCYKDSNAKDEADLIRRYEEAITDLFY